MELTEVTNTYHVNTNNTSYIIEEKISNLETIITIYNEQGDIHDDVNLFERVEKNLQENYKKIHDKFYDHLNE